MTEFNRTESAKWAQESQKVAGDLQAGVEKALAEAAGRGFPAAPGVTLALILAAGQEAKGKLTEANGKIYDDRRGVISQQEEFALKLIVQFAKLAMELYREELINALAIEQAETAADREQSRAAVDQQVAEIEARQVAIIRDRATVERRIVTLKEQLVSTETATLSSERDLIAAELATAEKKLEIIASIYEVLAAEELVLAAENHRAETLLILQAAQRVVANIKKEMVPFYIEKATARQELAQAITEEIPVKIAIENLGYRRIDLKTAEEEAQHQIRAGEVDVELARLAYTRANTATEIARAQSQTVIQGFMNAVQASIQAKKQAAALAEIDIKLSANLARTAIMINNDVAITSHEASNLTAELSSILSNLTSRANDEAGKVAASAHQISKTGLTSLLSRKIVEGAF